MASSATMFRRAVGRLSYANVTATLALFVALGGTGYAAATLPRNSVGPQQLRSGAVGHSELARDAVTSGNVREGTLALTDLAPSVRAMLATEKGPAGPPGATGGAGPAGAKGDPGSPGRDAVSLWEVVNSDGERITGTATHITPVQTGVFDVFFASSVGACASVATLARVEGGAIVDPPAGRVTVAASDDHVRVHTYNADGTPGSIGFHLIVVC